MAADISFIIEGDDSYEFGYWTPFHFTADEKYTYLELANIMLPSLPTILDIIEEW